MNSQHELIQALAGCTYAPGTWSKRFVRNISSRSAEWELTAKEEACAWRLAYTFRRQMPKEIAEEALRRKMDHVWVNIAPAGKYLMQCQVCKAQLWYKGQRGSTNPCPGPPEPKPERKPKKNKAAVIQQEQTVSTQKGLF